jgi:hypothetical protein
MRALAFAAPVAAPDIGVNIRSKIMLNVLLSPGT